MKFVNDNKNINDAVFENCIWKEKYIYIQKIQFPDVNLMNIDNSCVLKGNVFIWQDVSIYEIMSIFFEYKL